MKKAVLVVAAALALAPLPASSQDAPLSKDKDHEPSFVTRNSDRDSLRELLDDLSQTELRDRLVAAIETVEGACAADIRDFCGKVSRGEGRVSMCLRAHEDQLSRRCQLTLYQVARKLERAVERIAESCWNDIQAHCGDTDKIGQCVVQKSASFSPSCRAVVAALRQTVQGLTALKGMAVYSSDDKNLGRVVDVVKGPDGKVQAIQIEVGHMLGLGNKVVTINRDKFEQLADRIRARLSVDEVRSLPEAEKQ